MRKPHKHKYQNKFLSISISSFETSWSSKNHPPFDFVLELVRNSVNHEVSSNICTFQEPLRFHKTYAVSKIWKLFSNYFTLPGRKSIVIWKQQIFKHHLFHIHRKIKVISDDYWATESSFKAFQCFHKKLSNLFSFPSLTRNMFNIFYEIFIQKEVSFKIYTSWKIRFDWYLENT